MADPIFVLDIDPAGIVASHPRRVELPVLVAPIPDERKGSDVNTIRAPLVTIGCMRIFRDGFAFDSSLVSPDAERSFTKFSKLMLALQKQDDANPKRFPPCSVFGHADPTGDDDYNKTLSGRRALAVYAVLIRKVEIWEELFKSFKGDQWGMKAIQTMLSKSLKRASGTTAEEPPFYTGPIDGKKTPETNDAVAAYLESRNFAGGKTLDLPGDVKRRAQLFNEYMDAICHDPDGNRFVLNADTDFIARNKDKGKQLKGDVQGCGEFNPIFLFSKEDDATFKKDKLLAKAVRDPLNVVNRRVVVYIFKHGTEIDPQAWPCPHAREGQFKCTLRFWSDHLKRRNVGPEKREFGENMAILKVDQAGVLTERPVDETGNTMACRFYHAFAVHSPCEAKLKEVVVRFKVDSFDARQEPLNKRRYVVQSGEVKFAAVIRGRTEDNGEIRIPVFEDQTKLNVKLDVAGDPTELDDDSGNKIDPAPPKAEPNSKADSGFDTDRFPDEDQFVTMVLDAGVLNDRDPEDDLAIKQRLYNLGFGERPPTEWSQSELDIALLQYKHRRNLDRATPEAVRAKIFDEHDLEDPTPIDEDLTISDNSAT